MFVEDNTHIRLTGQHNSWGTSNSIRLIEERK